MATYRVNPAERLSQPLQPGNHSYEATLTPKSHSIYLGLAIGLLDCFLAADSAASNKESLRREIETLVINSALPLHPPEACETIISQYEWLCQEAGLHILKKWAYTSPENIRLLCTGIEFSLTETVPALRHKELDSEDLTPEEECIIFDSLAAKWKVKFYVHSNALCSEYGQASASQISLKVQSPNKFSVLYSEAAYETLAKPYEPQTRGSTRQRFGNAANILRQFIVLSSSEGGLDDLGQFGEAGAFPASAITILNKLGLFGEEQRNPYVEELPTNGTCRTCNTEVRDEPLKLCPGHLVCDSCRSKAMAFGQMNCPVTNCKEIYSEEEYREFLARSASLYNMETLPLGYFTCVACSQKKYWQDKVSCPCNVCVNCKAVCFCDARPDASPDHTCSLCKLSPVDPFSPPCGHVYCHSCAWTHFYETEQCCACQAQCKLDEVKPSTDRVQPLRQPETSSKVKHQLIQSLASVLMTSNASLASLHATLQPYVSHFPQIEEGSLQRVAECAEVAQTIASKECTHKAPDMLCNCTNRHCLSCLLDAKQRTESIGMPSMCTCGVPLDLPTAQRLAHIQELLG